MRQKVVKITSELLTDLFKQGEIPRVRVVDGLPADAELVRIIPDYSYGWEVRQASIGLVYQSAEFPELERGALIPELQVVFERIPPTVAEFAD